MSETIKQQPEGDLHDKYTLKGEGFVWPLIRSVLIFIGTLLVAIVGAEVEAGRGLDPFAIVYCVLLTPFAFINAFFQWLLYHFNIDRKPLASARFCLLECVLVVAVLILVAWVQDYAADILWYEPVEVLFWYSQEAAVLFTALIVVTFYLIKKWVTTIGHRKCDE